MPASSSAYPAGSERSSRDEGTHDLGLEAQPDLAEGLLAG